MSGGGRNGRGEFIHPYIAEARTRETKGSSTKRGGKKEARRSMGENVDQEVNQASRSGVLHSRRLPGSTGGVTNRKLGREEGERDKRGGKGNLGGGTKKPSRGGEQKGEEFRATILSTPE